MQKGSRFVFLLGFFFLRAGWGVWYYDCFQEVLTRCAELLWRGGSEARVATVWQLINNDQSFNKHKAHREAHAPRTLYFIFIWRCRGVC